MKKVMFIAYECSARYLSFFSQKHPDYRIIYVTNEHIFLQGVEQFIRETVASILSGTLELDGVLSSNDLGASIASIIAHRVGFPGPDPVKVLQAQNKYISRQLQNEFVPECVPSYSLARDVIQKQSGTYPLFVKPVRGSLSFFSYTVRTAGELYALNDRAQQELPKANHAYEQLLQLVECLHPHAATFNELICERIARGRQVTLDGYVVNGKVSILGVTESFFVPGTISFIRFDFPADFSENVVERMHQCTVSLVKGLGLDMTHFNIEFVIDERDDVIYLIELNPRMSMQFTPLIAHVLGTNPISIACEIATGKIPDVAFVASGNWSVCSSCVVRRHEDGRLTRVPTVEEIRELESCYPGVLIFPLVEEGKKLSDYRQDSCSFRYCLFTIPGNSVQEIEEKRMLIEQELQFEFE